MAVIHRATLTPGKLELLAGWLPARPWCPGVEDLRQLGAYRFDDPAGEVGLEAFLLQAADGPVLHVPVTYRAAPLEGAEDHLVGTMEHSVLGTALGVRRLRRPGLGHRAGHRRASPAAPGPRRSSWGSSGEEPREPTATVAGSGLTGTEVPVVDLVTCTDAADTTLVRSDGLELTVVRRVGADARRRDADRLLGGRRAGGAGRRAGGLSRRPTPQAASGSGWWIPNVLPSVSR